MKQFNKNMYDFKRENASENTEDEVIEDDFGKQLYFHFCLLLRCDQYYNITVYVSPGKEDDCFHYMRIV